MLQAKYFMASSLCHSLVRSELWLTVDGQLSTKESTAQVCDATEA